MKKRFHLYMLQKSLDYTKDKIIYHENSHLLVSYFFGVSCKYVSYDIISKSQFVGGNIEVDFTSKAHAYINLPTVIEKFLFFNNNGGSLNTFSTSNNISSDKILDSIRNYITILYAGYEAEKKFFGGIKHLFTRLYIKKYSQDMTIKDMQEDNTKIQKILDNLGFDSYTKNTSKKNSKKLIKKLLKTSKLRELFDRFYCISQTKKIIHQAEIEKVLSDHNFRLWADEQMKKMN
jgi:hypothetical protein